MIFHANAVPSITGAMAYVLGPGRDNAQGRATLLGGQGFGFEPRTSEDVKLATEMMEHNASPNMQASRTKKCYLDALHASAAWHPDQRADQDEMLEAGRFFLKSIGMENSMAVFHRHSDKKHPHMHMVASLIDPKTGLTYDRYQFRYKAQHAAIEWERAKDQITPARQPQHELAGAARDLDWDRLQALLRNKEGRIAFGKVDQALALGGHFGPHMVAHRVAFHKHLGIEREKPMTPEQRVELDNLQNKDAAKHIWPNAPLNVPTRDTRPQRGQTERGDLEDLTDATTPGLLPPKRDSRNREINGNFVDHTDATTPGLLPPKRNKSRGLER
jgi:hypothetical protein